MVFDLGQYDTRRFRRETLAPVEGLVKVVLERTMGHMDESPDPSLRCVAPEKRLWHRALVELGRATIRLVVGRHLCAIALDAIEIRSQARLAPLGGENPRPLGEGWLVARMPPVPASQLGDPVGVDVLVESHDRAIHRPIRRGRPVDWVAR